MELRENSVREWVADKTLNILHISVRVNPANIFTKEMRDGAQFWWLRDSFMCPLSDFIQQSILVIHHQSKSTSHMTLRQGVPLAVSSKTVVAQKILFCGFVFHSHMPDFLNYFSPVERGPSAYTKTSSCRSIRRTLRSDIIGEWWFFCRFPFPHQKCIESTLVGGIACSIVHGRKDGGCCSMCTLRVSFAFLAECHINHPRGLFLGPLA
jgi:hypothetical protein